MVTWDEQITNITERDISNNVEMVMRKTTMNRENYSRKSSSNEASWQCC
jgi:hypothetical protein